MSTPPILHAMAQNSKYELEKVWKLKDGRGNFKALQVEKRGGMYLIPGCAIQADLSGSSWNTIAQLPDDVPKPVNNISSLVLSIYPGASFSVDPGFVTSDGKVVIAPIKSGSAIFYFPALFWFEDDCQ